MCVPTARFVRLAGFTRVAAALIALSPVPGLAAQNYQVFVSNERSGDVTVIDGGDFKVLATIPVGKRPRGIHAGADGKTVFVALSGTPIAAPPKLDAHGNPIFEKHKDDDDEEEAKSDKSADSIGVLDVAQRKLTGRILAGSDPEEFALSRDGTQLYVSNEDVKTASVLDIATGKVQHIVPVGQEPEGVATLPDGKHFYVTCESGGDVFVIDSASYQAVAQFKVEPRPRSAAFLSAGGIGFIPSESVAKLNVIDTVHSAVLKVIALPEGSRPMSVQLSPDEKTLYVSNGRAGTISAIDTHTYELRSTIKVGTRPWGIAVSPDGKFLFSANGPSNDVSVVDLGANQEVARVKAGMSPWSVAIVPSP